MTEKIICDCAMSLNDDREKPHKGKGESSREKSDQSIVSTEISIGVLEMRHGVKIL